MSKTRHIAAVAVIALLVLSPIASIMATSGPIGTASGETDNGCDAPWWMQSAGCQLFDYFSDPKDDSVSEYSAKLDAYRDAKSAEAQTETALTMAENSVHDAEDRAWLKAEQAFLEAYLNGGNLSESKQAGVEAIQSHYSTRQTNLIELQNNFVTSLWGIQNASSHFSVPTASDGQYWFVNRDNYPALSVDVTVQNKTFPGGYDRVVTSITDLSSEPLTLADGTTKQAQALSLDTGLYNYTGSYWKMTSLSDTTNADSDVYTYNFLEGDDTLTQTWDSYSMEFNYRKVSAQMVPDDYPESPTNQTHITDLARWGDVWTDYVNQSESTVASFETFADGSYQALEDGTISADDVLSRLNEMELAADIDWQNATFNEGVVALSSMGLAAPSGSTAYMNLSYQTSFDGTMQTTTGLLMSQTNPPEGTWQTNLTYNSSQLSGAQVIMQLDGNQTSIKGDFTINEALTANGTTIEGGNITTDQATYETTNLTDLRNEIETLSERIGTLRNQSLSTGGGGATAPAVAWPDLGIPGLDAIGQWIAVFVVAFFALLLLTVVS